MHAEYDNVETGVATACMHDISAVQEDKCLSVAVAMIWGIGVSRELMIPHKMLNPLHITEGAFP